MYADPTVPPLLENVERAELRYLNGHRIRCLLHYFLPPLSRYDVDWFDRVESYTSPHFLRVIGLVDRRNLPAPCIIIVTEYCDNTLASWARANYAEMVQDDGYGYRFTTQLAHILRSLFEVLKHLWDRGLRHGNINMDTVFLVDGAVKLGMFDYQANDSDMQQVEAMLLRLLPYDLIPLDALCLVDSIAWSSCWSRAVSDEQWRLNNARFAAKHPELKTAAFQLRQRENIYYRLGRLLVEDPAVYGLVHFEMELRMPHLLLDSNLVEFNWLVDVSALSEDHYFRQMLNYSHYDDTDPFAFAEFGRHFKVHKDPDISYSRAEAELEAVITGYRNTIFEVLSGFVVDIDEYGE